MTPKRKANADMRAREHLTYIHLGCPRGDSVAIRRVGVPGVGGCVPSSWARASCIEVRCRLVVQGPGVLP